MVLDVADEKNSAVALALHGLVEAVEPDIVVAETLVIDFRFRGIEM